MAFTVYDASAPVFVTTLTNMRNWLDKAAAEKPEAELLAARLAPDMRPLPAQFQMASDTAKNGVARLCGLTAPTMPDEEASFTELKERCDKTIAFIQSIDPSQFDGSAERDIELRLRGDKGYRFKGQAYLTNFALPNFFFHATTAYAILRMAGVSLGKPDFLQHLGAPTTL